MKKRSNLEIMAKLIGMVRPLLGYMILAITLGLIGHLLASFITLFAGYAALKVWGFQVTHSFVFFFVCMVVFAITRGFARYTEQSCNHYIAFKLLALIRAKYLQPCADSALQTRGKGQGGFDFCYYLRY